METTTYVALSVQDALTRKMDIIAHNLANLGTGAFKSEKPLFIQILDEASGVAYVEDYGIVRDLSAGPMQVTDSPLDVAIEGDAFLAVEYQNETRYTRNGHLQLDADRMLVTSTGYPLYDVDDRTIQMPIGVTDITISPDGSVSADGAQLARLKMVAFENPQALERAADSLYLAGDQKPIPPRDAALIQGTLEESNVRPVVQMTEMIQVMRAYEESVQLSKAQHDLELDTIDKVIAA